MKYILLVCGVILLSGCDELKPTSTEEYLARVKYCKDNGLDYDSRQNGTGYIRVDCLANGHKLESKWEKE